MFGTLLESRALRQRRPGGTAVSMATHAGIVIAAAALSRGTPSVPHAAFRDPPPIWVAPRPVQPSSEPVRCHFACNMDFGSIALRHIVMPGTIKPSLPDFGNVVPRIPMDWGSTGAVATAGAGASDGVANATPVGGEPWAANAVESPAVPVSAPQPRYPDALRDAGVEGRVVVRFVIDTAGRVEPATLSVIESTHELFARAVRGVLPRMRFRPANVGGRHVRMLAEMPFEFRLRP